MRGSRGLRVARVTAMSIKKYMAEVSACRGRIMGVCMLFILFFHGGVRLREPWNYFCNLLWGVDIFFFASGMGVFSSLSNNGDTLSFYARRARRILPAYIPVVLLFFIPVIIDAARAGALPAAVQELLGNLIMLGWVNRLENQFNWYPQVICLVYLASPALFLIVSRAAQSARAMLALFAVAALSQVCFFNSHFLIAWSRMLYFLMGLAGAALAARDARFKLNVPIMLILFVIGNGLMYYGQRFPEELLWGYGLSWYPGLLIIPGAMLIMCRGFALCERVRALSWLGRLFELMGKYSFEIFLIHLLLFSTLTRLGLEPQGNLQWLLAIIASVPLAVGYGRLIKHFRA